MLKEAQQAASGPTSLGATSEDGAHPQLSSGHDALADSTTEADPGNSAPNDSILTQRVLVDQTKSAEDGLKTAHTDLGTNKESKADEILKKIKLEDLSDLLKDIRSAFFTLDPPQDEPIIGSDESEEEVKKDKYTHATSHDSQKDELEQQKAKAEAGVISLKVRPSYPDINQLTDVLVTSLKPKFSKILASHDFAICLPNALKELPSKFTELSREIKELNKHVQDMEIKLPGDLKKIPKNNRDFTFHISVFHPSSEKAQDFGFPSKSIKQGATTKDVPSVGQVTASLAEGEKNTNLATMNAEPNLQYELVDLLGIDVVTQYYNKKLLYDKYYDNMLKRRKSSKITNCDVLTQKGSISLKVHREDGTIKSFQTQEGNTLIILKKELNIDFNKPLKEQDPLNELNDLADKKRKRTGDLKDHSSSTKKHKSSVQHEEEGY
ncbi:hypothetical protein Tco_0232637 [Tanacetum coccineum]